MQFRHNGWIRTTVTFAMLLGAAMFVQTSQPIAFAQTNISGDIAGRVTDPSGAVVPGATVTVVDVSNGSTRTTTTNSGGTYRVPLLPPDTYKITVNAPGFQATEQTTVLTIGSVKQADVQMTVGKSSQTVMVSANTVPLLHTEDAQITTTFTMQQVQTLPNPGNDLTFIAQTAPGTVMNTQSGYGNFSAFGLPAVANTFTVNGGYENDPFLNLSNSGATNLLLGNNDIANVTVTSNAYTASFGGLGGAQISETSRSGTNGFHGNATYWWNGSSMNANNYFNNQTGTKRPFSNVNQWAAAIGGPIKRNKTFFFFNYEGLRVVLPTRATVYAPDAAYEANTLANLNTNGLSAEAPVYQNVFNLYNNAPGYSTATQSTSDTAFVGPPNCTITPANPGGNCPGYGTVVFNGNAGNFTHEWLMTGRIDQNLSDKDHLFGHAKIDKGLQASYTNVLDPIFNADSPQPQYEGQLGETHTFSPNLTNQFLFAAIYYRAIFTNTNLDAATALVPFSLIFVDGDLGNNQGDPSTWPGGYDIIWPQGRNVTGYQFQDDVTWTKGKHSISFGWTMRRDDVTDYSPSEFTASPEAVATNNSFEEGYSDEWFQQFPTRLTQPVALYGMGWYIQDQWKPIPNLTVTAGLRMEHNSNPVCQTNCFSRLSGNFSDVSNDPTSPYNQLIVYDQHQAMHHLQVLAWEPRVGFAWLPGGSDSHTTVRGGFGMFSDSFPGQVADSFLNNAPGNVPFTIYGPAFGGGNTALGPAAPGSAGSIAAGSYAAFNAGFPNGASYSTLSTLPGFSAPGVVNADQKINYPTYVEYSLSVERQVNRSTALSLQYVGNITYHQPVLNNSVNTFNGGGAAGFPELSTTDAPNNNFGAVTEVQSIARSNYNGMVASVTHQSKSLTLQFNYAYSHALDEISNGGFNGFGANSTYPDSPFDVRANYGNADYDTRNYISASYVYSLPHFGGPNVLTGGWEFSGTVFHNSGFPFSIVDSSTATSLVNYGGPLYAKQIAPLSGNHCGGANNSLFGAANPCSFAADYGSSDTTSSVPLNPPTNFAQSRRNQIFGPSYTDTDLSILKNFNIPHLESGKLVLGAQFFNLFNHPNFAQPGNDVSSQSTLGLVSGTVNTPTSILGSFLGGDASPRLIQLKGSFVF
jgi:hypothetical protein